MNTSIGNLVNLLNLYCRKCPRITDASIGNLVGLTKLYYLVDDIVDICLSYY